MKILAIETATRVCGAALLIDEAVVAESSVEERNIHAERILRLIDGVLRTPDSSVSELDAVAVSIGPGSFTGLRIGVGTAKGIAYAAGKPLIAVPTLEALAFRVLTEGGEPPPSFILPVLDARRDEVYAQLFAVQEGAIEPIGEPRDATVAEVAGLCAGKEVIVAGEGSAKIAEAIPGLPLAPPPLSRCSAAAVARLAGRLFREGRCADPALVEPAYVKEFFTRHRPHP